MTPLSSPPPNSFAVPIAIIIAGMLIGGSIIYSNSASGRSVSAEGGQNSAPVAKTVVIKPGTTDDHVLGSRNASLMFVEYSDLECPFCKVFQGTMHALMDEYGKDGRIAWTYRHFPIDSLHPKARKESEATECANELGGNQKFWQYLDKIYEITPSNNGLDPAKLKSTATEIGLDTKAFDACLSSGKYAKKVEGDYQQAVAAGGNGTPHTAIVLSSALSAKNQEKVLAVISSEFGKIAPNAIIPKDLFYFNKGGKELIFSGSLPQPVIKAIIDSLLTMK